MIIKQTPVDYGYPFTEFRQYQREAIEKIYDSRFGYVIAPAPTGSGKSLVAAVLSKHKQTRVVTHTLNLIAQYEKLFADAIYGMANYPCELLPGHNCDSCIYPEQMSDCPMSGSCHYLRAKHLAIHSNFSCCSYAYYFRGKIKETLPDFLYLDEAHYLPDLLMQEYEITIKPALVERFGVAPFKLNPKLPQLVVTKLVADWLDDLYSAVYIHLNKLQDGLSNRDPGLAIRIKSTKMLLDKIGAISRGIKDIPNMFLVHETDGDAIRITPLSSSPFFASFFKDKAKKTILTSATIGSEKLFASLLGLKHYEFVETPNRFAPHEMPVYVVSDAPKLSYKSGLPAYKKQVEILERLANDFFPDRKQQISGLLHFASKSDTYKFAELLNQNDLFRGRTYIHKEDSSTEEKVEEWENRMESHPNTIALSWCFHTGLDAGQVDMNIIMKVPFPQIDEKQKLMFERNPFYYRWKTGNTLEQAAGRIRRGEPDHYEKAGEPTRKLVAILDNNYTRCINSTSNHFKQCITKI